MDQDQTPVRQSDLGPHCLFMRASNILVDDKKNYAL